MGAAANSALTTRALTIPAGDGVLSIIVVLDVCVILFVALVPGLCVDSDQIRCSLLKLDLKLEHPKL